MNIAKKIYCRIFQKVFHIAIPLLPYREPTILMASEEITTVLKQQQIYSVLLITDPGIYGFGLTKHLENCLAESGIRVTVYAETDANPTTANVEAALKAYYENNCRALIGFGGGSSIDCAKATGVRIARPNKTLAQMEGILKVHHRLPTIIAVPTTAGTGSETTLAAVITDSETRHKYPINDFPLIPRYALLDPRATVSLPKGLTATTGMDALTHAVEAYIGRSTTKKSRTEALSAVKLIFRYIDRAYTNGEDLEARENMLKAAYLAGCAFTKSYVGYVHAVAHTLGGAYNTPHGLANAVLLPYVLEDYGAVINKKLKDLAIAAGIADESVSEADAADRFLRAIRDMKKRLGIPDTIAGIRESDIPKLARKADHEGNPLYPVPVLRDAKELERYYRMVMEV